MPSPVPPSKGFAVDAAGEIDGDAVAGLGLGALALRRIAAVGIGDALDRFIDLGVGDLGDRLLQRETLEVGELDLRHHLDRDGVGEVGLAGEQFLDLVLFRRHRHLRLGRKAEAALGEDLRVGVADGLVDGLGHDRAAIELLQMGDRHLARTEAVETDLVLHVDQLGVRLGIEIGCRHVDLELVLQSLIEGFRNLHHLLPLWSALNGADIVLNFARQTPRASKIPDAKRLVRAEGLEPPQLSSLEPKSSASTSSATPASLASSRPRCQSMTPKMRSGFRAAVMLQVNGIDQVCDLAKPDHKPDRRAGL